MLGMPGQAPRRDESWAVEALGTNPSYRPYPESMKTSAKTLILVMLTFAAALLAAQSKPNFSGTWQLNMGKFDLGGTPISKLVVGVEHKEPVFKYTAKGIADGQEFEETETLTTDGRPGTDSRGGAVRTHWEGMTLVSESTGPDGGALYEARVMISEDGKTITRDFLRKSADDPQKRHEIYDKQ